MCTVYSVSLLIKRRTTVSNISQKLTYGTQACISLVESHALGGTDYGGLGMLNVWMTQTVSGSTVCIWRLRNYTEGMPEED